MLKSVNFRNIEWNSSGPRPDLVSLLNHTLSARPNVDEVRFTIDGQVCELNHRREGQTVFLHFTTFVEGGERATYPRMEGVPEVEAGTAPPPPGSEFTEREIAVAVRNTMLGFVVAGHARHTTVERAIRGLIALDHGEDLAYRLVLSSRASEDEIQRLLEEGVDYIDLGLALPFADAEQVTAAQTTTIGTTILNAIASSLSSRFGTEHSEEDIRRLTDMNSHLVLKADKRGRVEHTDLLTDIASQVAETEEDFVIRTKAGNKFTRESLSIKSTYNQSGPRAVLHYLEAWSAIESLLDSVG